MQNDEFELMFCMNDKTSKDIQQKHDRAIHAIHLPGTTYKILWHEWGTHRHPWTKITYFRAIVSGIIMSSVTWWAVCRERTCEQYTCYVVVDSWFGFSAVMFFVTRFFLMLTWIRQEFMVQYLTESPNFIILHLWISCITKEYCTALQMFSKVMI